MSGRALNQKTAPQKIEAPKTLDGWHQLMRQAIERAERLGYRHAHGLRKAFVDGKAERHLRMMGIIHPGDLLRVFPEKV